MSFKLVCAGARFRVSHDKLRALPLFADRPELLEAPSYEVKCKVSESVFEAFVDALEGEKVEVTEENFRGLRDLSDEFGFSGLDETLGGFEARASRGGSESAVLRRVSVQEREIESLKREVQALRLAVPRGDLASGLATLASLVSRIDAIERAQRDQAAALARTEAATAALGARIDGGGAEAVASMKSEIAALKARAAAPEAKASLASAPLRDSPSPGTRKRGRGFKFTGDAFGGIIAALTRECGGNVDEKGVVTVTARDRINDDCHERNAVDLENRDYFYCSEDKPGAWLCLDFKARRVKPTYYSLRTSYGGYHLKSWVIEGSLDGSGWSELDRHKNNEDLNGTWFEKTYEVSKSGEFRFIRLRSIDKDHNGGDCLLCSAFELFGTLLE